MPASAARLAEGFDLLEVGAAVFDDRSGLVYCNSAFRRLRNYPENVCREGATLESLLRFNAKRGDFGDGDVDAQVAERIAEIDKSAERTIEREMADGQILAIRYHKTPSGGLLVTFEDRTAERRAEAALAASEERYALAARITSDIVYDWDLAADRLHVSDMFARLTQFDVEKEGPRGWFARVHPEDQDRYAAATRAHLKGESETLDVEYRVGLGTGGYAWFHDRGAGMRGPDGRITRIVGAMRDVTDVKEAKAERDSIEARLASSLATISDGILMIDAENRVQIWNDRYYEIFSEACGGADLSNVIVKDRPFFEMLRDGYELGMFNPHPDGVDGWIATRVKAWDDPAMRREMELANGMWILVNERALPDGGRISVYTDITELKRREFEAEAARRRFEDAIESISTGFAMFDGDDRLQVWNSRFQDYFAEMRDVFVPGAQFRDMLGASIERGLFPAAAGDEQRFLEAIMARRTAGDGRVRENQLEDGRWLQISDHRTRDGGLVSIYTDVTELKTRELEMRRQSAVLEATLENMGQGITMVDGDLNTLAFNRKFFELMEFPEDRFGQGFTMADAFRYNAERGEYGPGDVEAQVAERVALSRKFQPHRFERVRPDGSVLEIVGNPIEGGGFVSTYTDITERKRAEREIEAREAELKAALQDFNAVLDTIDYGILFLGPDLRTKLVNRAFKQLWHIPQEFIDANSHVRELIEYNRNSGFYDIGPDAWDDWLDNRIDTISAGDIPRTAVRRADGSVVSYQCVALPDGGRMLTYFDITELKQREAEIALSRDKAEAALEDLRKAQERLIQAEKMASLGQLTAGIAHEIKNPLNFVNNFARLSDELLGELAEVLEAPIAALDEEARDDAEDLLDTVRGNLAKINEHGRRADSIVKNMLLHSREGPSEKQSVALNGVAAEALNLAYHGARAENPNFNIEMKTDFAADLGEVECFPQDLMRVFLNLITNGMYAANKRREAEGDGFSPEISVTTRIEGGAAVIEVRDNGAGIPPETRERIFLPFFTTKPAGEGTGLGLSLSFDIVVKQHGGELTVESEPNRFTAFRVTLPRAMSAGEETKE